MRKLPTQGRARRTIAAIFEATAQIVDSEGPEALSTNKVAQRAGVSIGTLYQYFPTKEAIVVAMIAQERQRVMSELQSMLMSAVQASTDLPSILRGQVRALLAALSRLKDTQLRPLSPALLFVATRAVLGVIRSASLEDSPLLDTQELEDELVRMVWRLVSVD